MYLWYPLFQAQWIIFCQPMLKLRTQNCFHKLFLSNSTNNVVPFDEKSVNVYWRLPTRSHPTYAPQVGCSIFHSVKFEQPITHWHLLLRREIFIDGTAVPIILCGHVLITHDIFIIFWVCWLFSVNIDGFKTTE